jgi:competence protein ComGC
MARFRHLGGLLRETWAYARANKAWWLVPMVVVLLIMALLITVVSSTTPVIYTLF